MRVVSLTTILLVLATLALAGCGQYRLVRTDEIEWPTYEPRPVVVPDRCEALIQRTVADGAQRLTDAEATDLQFCQQQQLVRAQEEEAAARKLEAHAEAASFVLRLATVTVGALIAVIAWAL